jgi:hypothetical protein
MMHGPINFKSPNNTSKWQMGFNSAFKGLMNNEADILVRKTCHQKTFHVCTISKPIGQVYKYQGRVRLVLSVPALPTPKNLQIFEVNNFVTR